jgi:hypothetical protein
LKRDKKNIVRALLNLLASQVVNWRSEAGSKANYCISVFVPPDDDVLVAALREHATNLFNGNSRYDVTGDWKTTSGPSIQTLEVAFMGELPEHEIEVYCATLKSILQCACSWDEVLIKYQPVRVADDRAGEKFQADWAEMFQALDFAVRQNNESSIGGRFCSEDANLEEERCRRVEEMTSRNSNLQ